MSKTFYCVVLDSETHQINNNFPCIKKLNNQNDDCDQVTYPSNLIDVSGCTKQKVKDCSVTIINLTPPKTVGASVWMIICPGDD